MPSTHYDLLGVSQTATISEIKDRYRAAVRKCHPDVAEDKVQATRLFIQVSRAYRVLRDSEQRRRYDQTLQSGGHVSAPSAPSASVPSASIDVAQTLRQAEHAYFQGQMREARTLCAKVLKQDGRHARALTLLGDILLGLGKPEEAAVAFRLSLQVAPSAVLQAKLTQLTRRRAVAAVPASDNNSEKKGEEVKPPPLFKRLFHRT